MKFNINIILLLILSSILASCKTNSENNYNSIKLNVVHISQLDDYSCATTSIAMVISYFEEKILDKNEVWQISGSNIFNVKSYGNDMDGLKKIADHYGYTSKFREGLSINDIEETLANGIPIMINILQPKKTGATHAVLVVGYDRNKKILFINDPAMSVIGKSISYKKLNDLWSAYLKKPGETTYKMTYKSAFIIYPKN